MPISKWGEAKEMLFGAFRVLELLLPKLGAGRAPGQVLLLHKLGHNEAVQLQLPQKGPI